MTQFMWILDLLGPHLNGGEPCSQDSKDLYSYLWYMMKRKCPYKMDQILRENSVW